MKCPNCKNEVLESELIPTILTSTLLCCPYCVGKSRHFAVIGTDPSAVFNEAQETKKKRERRNR